MSTDGKSSDTQKAEAFVRRLVPLLKASVDEYQAYESDDEYRAYNLDDDDEYSDDDDEYSDDEQPGDDSYNKYHVDDLNDLDDIDSRDTSSATQSAPDKRRYYADALDDLEPSVEEGSGTSDPSAYIQTLGTPSDDRGSISQTAHAPQAWQDARKAAVKEANEKKRGREATGAALVELQQRLADAHQAFEQAKQELGREMEAGETEEQLSKFQAESHDTFMASIRSVLKDTEAVDCYEEREFERFKSKLVECCNLPLGNGNLDQIELGVVDSEHATETRFENELEGLQAKLKTAPEDQRRELVNELRRAEEEQKNLATLRRVTAELAMAMQNYETARKEMEAYFEKNVGPRLDENSSLLKNELDTQTVLSDTIDRSRKELEAIAPPSDDSVYRMWDDAIAFCNQMSGQPRGSVIPEPAGFDDVAERQTEAVRKVKSEIFIKLRQSLEKAAKEFYDDVETDPEEAKSELESDVARIKRSAEEVPMGATFGRAAKESDLGLMDPKVAAMKEQILRRCDELLKLAGIEVQAKASAPAVDLSLMSSVDEMKAASEREAEELNRDMDLLRNFPTGESGDPDRFLDAEGLDELPDGAGSETEEEKAAIKSMLEKLGLNADPSDGAPTGGQPVLDEASTTDADTKAQDAKQAQPAEIEIGSVNSSNPTLWFSNLDNQERYTIASSSPGSGWESVTQFCSVLTVMWLNSPKASLSFADANPKDQIKMARLLIKNWRPADQASFAAKELGGTPVDKAALQEGMKSYGPKTKIWFGNNSHVMGAVFQPDNSVLMYDSNSGAVTNLTKDQFTASTQRANIFVVAAKSVSGENRAQVPSGTNTESDEVTAPGTSKSTSTGVGSQLTIESKEMISESTRKACTDILTIADLICRFDAVYTGSGNASSFEEAADRAVDQCSRKVNGLIDALRDATVKKQAEEKEGNKEASTDVLKLAKQCEANIMAQLSSLRASIRKQLESGGAKDVQTIGTTMFRSRAGIRPDPDAFEYPPVDLGGLPKALSSAGDLAKVGDSIVATADKAFSERTRLSELLTKNQEPLPADIDAALAVAGEYGETLDNLFAAQQQIAKPDGIVTKFVAANKKALAESPSLNAAKKALGSLKGLSKDIDKPVRADQEQLEEIIKGLQNPKDKKVNFQEKLKPLGDHRSTAQSLRTACLTLSKALQKVSK